MQSASGAVPPELDVGDCIVMILKRDALSDFHKEGKEFSNNCPVCLLFFLRLLDDLAMIFVWIYDGCTILHLCEVKNKKEDKKEK